MKITIEHLEQFKKQYDKLTEQYKAARVYEYDILRAAERAATSTREARVAQDRKLEMFKSASTCFLQGDDLPDDILKEWLPE